VRDADDAIVSVAAVQLPLDGIRVVDVTSVVMGPFATQILGDLGADVIVVEDRRGDTNRAMGVGPHADLSGVSMNLMRNKRSVGLDVKTERGYEALTRLVADADVFVTNLRPGSRTRARLTYDDLRVYRADLIYCAAAGFPPDSERADAPAYDDIIQSDSGVPDLTQRVGLPPVLMPTLVADKVAGLTIANTILTALFRRERTGDGQDITIAMAEVMRAFLLVEHGAGAIPEPRLGPAGYPRILTPHRRPQPTADGLIHVLAYDRSHYEALFSWGDRLDLLDDPRLDTRRSRIINGDSLYQDIATVLRQRTTAEWMPLLRKAGIPATTVGTLDDLIDDLPLAEHPHAGSYRVTPRVGALAPDAADVRRHAPLHGEHGREVLAEVGYTSDQLDRLERDGVLFRGMS
jgi:crotonobetainyl-CoA:carnitine CoA-transferase CaiB-like acyl-CoA transferase